MAQNRTPTRAHGVRDASDARIGSAARVRGRIQGDGDLLVEGHVEGSVTIRGDLTVAEGATVSAEAVSAASVTIDDGARFTGRLECEFELPPELGGASQGEARGRASARR